MSAPNPLVLKLRAGEIVEVRGKEEILATLDAHGAHDALPFMPEMLRYCGQRFRVYKRADKTCDTVRRPVALRMEHAVHLEDLRCDGSAHGGCQAGCLTFWKEAWLKRVEPAPRWSRRHRSGAGSGTPPGYESHPRMVCTEDVLLAATRRATADGEVFSCQATELPRATTELAWWDVRQYLRDLTSGNVGIVELVKGLSIALHNMLVRAVRRGVLSAGYRVVRSPLVGAPSGRPDTGRSTTTTGPGRSLVEAVRSTVGQALVERPHLRGRLRKTPELVLNLQPGELVQVRSRAEILETLDLKNRNRGLSFDVEMLPYCGGTYRVLRRVAKIIDEKTGRMMVLPNACIVLDQVVCRGCFSRQRLFCPRSIFPYWREIWLERVDRLPSQSREERASRRQHPLSPLVGAASATGVSASVPDGPAPR